MALILEVTASSPAQSGGAGRQVFHGQGGSIGREIGNAWVLPHSKVSGHHALISYRDAVYYIEDTSRNGVCLNSSKNRLVRGRPYALKSGDRILIDPYEIRVSITADPQEPVGRQGGALSNPRSPESQFDPFDPFGADDPFALRPIPVSGVEPVVDENANRALDPLELLGLVSTPAPSRPVPNIHDLDRGSPLDSHYQPPPVMPASESEAEATLIPRDYIPRDYDFLAPDDSQSFPPRSSPAPPIKKSPEAAPNVQRAMPPSSPLAPSVPAVDQPAPAPAPAKASAPAPEVGNARFVADRTPPPTADPAGTIDVAALLAGAGLDPAQVTPELARNFGEILRVVVAGVMDVMRSRQQIKDEFGMRMTRLRPLENNPLKFSADVDDALHNLLVKRNPAYLEPVAAFEDAFADLRDHQMAMLAGMRVAFESMLAQFDPDRLQKEFDRQVGKGLVPAKLRYWDLYRDRGQDIARDPEQSFRRLFGEAFARAYEEQLAQLKSEDPSGPQRSPRAPRRSDP